ncbi:hypothetical protein [Conexibacter sp. DBS9H8]|uniref:hypothetical protein n=1 Tax=Conexibacter sp. DBS9H8 TaxID=2937801 RepID=UPI00200E9BB8|nr:hypothetical protein [Conexibacter sp. DBS9H8]
MAIEPSGVLSLAPSPPRRHHHRGGADQSEPRDANALELALLRRGLAGVSHTTERCGRCHRTLLLGERVYAYASGALRCELCRDLAGGDLTDSHTVHGPEFGHTIRVLDRRGGR